MLILMMIIIAIALTLTQPAPCKRNTVAGHTTARLGQIKVWRC